MRSSATSIIPPTGVQFSGGVQPPTLAELKGLNDEELMAHLQNGCNDAFAVLFDRYYRLVLSIALKIVRDPGEAEDMMQTVFMEIFRSAAQFTLPKALLRCGFFNPEGLGRRRTPAPQLRHAAQCNRPGVFTRDWSLSNYA
jgi:hypothetical protein